MSQAEWIKCPTCGWNWKRVHTGRHSAEKSKKNRGKLPKPPKGEFTFEKVDLDNDAFISIRDLPGGRGNRDSFKQVDMWTLAMAKERLDYQELIKSLKNQIKKIQKVLE